MAAASAATPHRKAFEFDPKIAQPKLVPAFKKTLQGIGYNPAQIERITAIMINNLMPTMVEKDSNELIDRVWQSHIDFEHNQRQRNIILGLIPDDIQKAEGNLSLLVDSIRLFSLDYLVLDPMPTLGLIHSENLIRANTVWKHIHLHRIDQEKIVEFTQEVQSQDYSPEQKDNITVSLTPNLMIELVETIITGVSAVLLAGTPGKEEHNAVQSELERSALYRMSEVFKKHLPAPIQSSPVKRAFVTQKIEEMASEYIKNELGSL